MCAADPHQSILGITIDRRDALAVFKNVSDQSLILAILSWITPHSNWKGCEISLGESLSSHDNFIHIEVRGPSAPEVLKRLIEALARVEIPIIGQEKKLSRGVVLARASGNSWHNP